MTVDATSPRDRIPATAALLAGGASRRMGRDKAALPWRGEPLGIFVARRLEGWFAETLVSSDRPGVFAGARWRTVPDRFPGGGALAGLHGALSAAARPWIFLTACDMPFVREALVRGMWDLREGFDVVVPLCGGLPEPLCAFYAKECLAAAAGALEQGRRRVVSFFEAVRVRRVPEEGWRPFDPEGASFANLNTPEEYGRARGTR